MMTLEMMDVENGKEKVEGGSAGGNYETKEVKILDEGC